MLGREHQAIAVDRRCEPHTLLRNLAQRTKAEHLETTRIGEDRTAPSDKSMQPAELCHDLKPGTQPQVKGVAEHNLRAECCDLFRIDRFHSAIGAHWHEGRCIDLAMRKHQSAAPRRAAATQQFKFHGFDRAAWRRRS